MDSNQYLFETSIRGKNLKDSNIKEEVTNEVFELIQGMQARTEMEDYLRRFATILYTSLEALKLHFDTYCNNHAITNAIDMYPNVQQYEIPTTGVYYPYPEEVLEPKEVKKNKWYSLCELRLFMYAKTSKALALKINQRIDSCLQALSINSQRLWFKLIDEFYVNFDEFDKAKFINMLQENEDVNYYLDMLETLRGDVVPYNEEDMNLCIEKLKQIGIDKDQKAIQQRIISSLDVESEQSRLIDEKFRKKRTKESLKNRRK
jgi:hypothetical protein